MLARLVGFGRIVVFSWAIGLTALGNVYQTVNTLPNIVFEIVAGGALAAVVVPLLAPAINRGDAASVSRTASALLTWAVALLAPLAVVVAVAAGPIVDLLLGASATSAETAVATRMLIVFAPQLVLYGVGIVLTGVLQAHHKFAGPALAPLLSSLTVIVAYLVFAAVAGRGAAVESVDLGAELVLSIGTTAGVAVLALSLLVPLRGLGLRLRPTFRFDDGVAAKTRSLVAGGVIAVAGQQIALLVVLVLSQRPAPVGAMVAYTLAQTMFFLPWAVLAVPVATSAYPRLSAAHAASDDDGYQKVLSGALRAVILLCSLAAAALAATAGPVADVLTSIAEGEQNPDALALAIIAFAPGLLGYGAFALLSRALYAAGAARQAALATTVGWATVVLADLVLAASVPATHRVAVLAAGNSVGMVVLGCGLLVMVTRRAGRGSITGVARALAVGLIAAGGSAAAGLGLVRLIDDRLAPVLTGLAAGSVVLAVFAAIALVGDKGDVRSMLSKLRRR